MKKKFIRKPTRKSNILDLVFCNNPYLISDYKIIINSKISDHSTIRIDMAYQSKDNLKPRKVNIASTKLPVYDFMNADEEDWLRLNVILSKIDWRTLFNGLNAEEMLNIFLKEIECSVELLFQKKKCFEKEKNDLFSSGNKIPRKIRILMRNKAKISKSLLKTKSPEKYLKHSAMLEAIECSLLKHYEERRKLKEMNAISKIRKNPKAFYSYAKQFSRVNCNVGPFSDKMGNPVTDYLEMVEMLSSQYQMCSVSPKKV